MVELVFLLVKKAASVKYAIHPVVDRMPGHVNAMPTEADVNYEIFRDGLGESTIYPCGGRSWIIQKLL